MKIDICECENILNAVDIFDSPTSNCSFNIYFCDHCGNIYKECIFGDKGIFILRADNSIEIKKGN